MRAAGWAPVVRSGSRAIRRQRPPPKAFLGIGAGLLILNHVFVVVGWGLSPELLMTACWVILMGAWVQFAGRSFDAVWERADPKGWRVIGLTLLTLVAAMGLAEAVAWCGYGQHLLD